MAWRHRQAHDDDGSKRAKFKKWLASIAGCCKQIQQTDKMKFTIASSVLKKNEDTKDEAGTRHMEGACSSTAA
jgi:hypothetical protein